MLNKNPKTRLGSANGLVDIINHSWCKKIKLSEVMHK